MRVVNPGVPAAARVDRREARSARARLLPATARRYVLAVGTAEPRKDLPGLVRAFADVAARHDDVSLVLAGPPGWGEAR